MKYASIALNVILLLLVGNLYFQQFSAKKVVTEGTLTQKDGTTVAVSPLKVVYVNADSLQEKYTYFKQQKAAFEKKEKDLMASLDSKGQNLQQKAIALQQKAQQGNTPPAQLQAEEQQLMKEQQSIVSDRDSRVKKLAEETNQFNEGLMKKVAEVLEQLKKDKGYDYVLSYTKVASPFLFVNPNYDVTNEVVDILNNKK